MNEQLLNRINRLKELIPLSSIYPIKDYGTSDCPICNGKGKFFAKNGWARCYRSNCDLTISNGGKAYDLISLYRYRENLFGKGSFFRAVKELEHMAGIGEEWIIQENERSFLLNRVMDIYQSELRTKQGSKAINYLRSRGLNDLLIETLGIGYASHTHILREYNLDEQKLRSHNLINEKGQEVFSNRIIFPIRDINGNLMHMTGRYLGPSANDYIPRWKHTTNYMGTGVNAYLGLEEHIKGWNEEVFLTEGYMDALSLYQYGFPTLCSFGLNGLNNHMGKLSKFRRITCIYDIDTFDEDHPNYPLEYKSWRVVIPQLIDMQLLFPRTSIYLLFIRGEGYSLRDHALYTAKDVNEWIIGWNPKFDDIQNYIINNRIDLVTYLIHRYGQDLQWHQVLLRLSLATGIGADLLSNYIPSDMTPLTYALSILSL